MTVMAIGRKSLPSIPSNVRIGVWRHVRQAIIGRVTASAVR